MCAHAHMHARTHRIQPHTCTFTHTEHHTHAYTHVYIYHTHTYLGLTLLGLHSIQKPRVHSLYSQVNPYFQLFIFSKLCVRDNLPSPLDDLASYTELRREAQFMDPTLRAACQREERLRGPLFRSHYLVHPQCNRAESITVKFVPKVPVGAQKRETMTHIRSYLLLSQHLGPPGTLGSQWPGHTKTQDPKLGSVQIPMLVQQ